MNRLLLLGLSLWLGALSVVQAKQPALLVEAGFGVSRYEGLGFSQPAPVGRFSLSLQSEAGRLGRVGLSLGIQSGDSFRLPFSKAAIDSLGGVPIAVQFKPMLDALITWQSPTLLNSQWFYWGNTGIAYRHLQVDRDSVNNLNGYSLEVGAGLGWQVNEQYSLRLGYQRIVGRTPQLVVNEETETALLRHLPAQQGLILSVTWCF